MSEPTENSPLIPDQPHLVSSSGTDSAVLPANQYFKRHVRNLARIVALVAAIEFVLVIATQILVSFAPFSVWQWSDQVPTIVFLTVVTFVLAIVNLRFAFPTLLNVLADFILAFSLVAWASSIATYGLPYDGQCRSYYYPPPTQPDRRPTPVLRPAKPSCTRIVLALDILIGISVALGAILALIHFVFLLLRLIASYKARAWQRPFQLYFPTGEITLSVTIKVLKQQPTGGEPSASESNVRETSP